MSREFKQTTAWINDHFDDIEIILQSGYNLWLNEQIEKQRDKANAK